MGAFANSEDPDQIQQNAVFHQICTVCHLRQNQSLERKNTIFF